MRIVYRKCLVCGKRLKITMKDKKGHYNGAHYFGKLGIPDTKNWNRKVIGYFKIGGIKATIVNDPPIKRKVEYWECEKCFNEE